MSDTSNRHGGPRDRGSADAYYGRLPSPHKYAGPTGCGPKIPLTDPVEIESYYESYYGCSDRKDWGQ